MPYGKLLIRNKTFNVFASGMLGRLGFLTEQPDMMGLKQKEVRNEMLKTNEKTCIEPNKTVLNFALIFRTDLRTFEKIRAYLLKSGASLIYQTKSTEKIFVARVGARVLKEGEEDHERFQ
jgi:hypothetical protein